MGQLKVAIHAKVYSIQLKKFGIDMLINKISSIKISTICFLQSNE